MNSTNSSKKDCSVQNEKIEYRRKRVYLLKIQGCTNQRIADKIGTSLSTIEKDLGAIRNYMREWYVEIAYLDKKSAFVSSILQMDVVLRNLWRLFYQETNSTESRKILSQITDTASKKVQMFESVKKFDEYVNDQMNCHSDPNSISFMDLLEENELGKTIVENNSNKLCYDVGRKT